MPDEPITYPYRVRPHFLTSAEAAFYHVLANLVKDEFFISPKVALSDLFFVARPNENVQYSNKLVRKNIDFLLMRRETLEPALGIELDYPKQADHRPIDNFMDGTFAAAGLPLIHVTVQHTYAIQELSLAIKNALAKAPNANLAHSDYSPICPRCGITMVLRFDKDGPYRGQKYYGCLNFPECQEIVAVKISTALP